MKKRNKKNKGCDRYERVPFETGEGGSRLTDNGNTYPIHRSQRKREHKFTSNNRIGSTFWYHFEVTSHNTSQSTESASFNPGPVSTMGHTPNAAAG